MDKIKTQDKIIFINRINLMIERWMKKEEHLFLRITFDKIFVWLNSRWWTVKGEESREDENDRKS